MSHPPSSELAQLNAIADEIWETLEERGYRVGVAISVDASFSCGRGVRSLLTRKLVADGLRRGASRNGVTFAPGVGGSLQLQVLSGFTQRIYRLRRAVQDESGDYLIEANSASSWTDFDEGAFFQDEHWVFAYTLSDDGIGEIFVAPVVDVAEGNPGLLVLGATIRLGRGTVPPAGGFRPSDEDDLQGFEDDSTDEGFGSGSGFL